MKTLKSFLILALILFSLALVSAWTPPSDGEFYDFYAIYNVTNITAEYIFQNGSTVCTAANGLCAVGDGDTHWNLTGSDWLYNDSNILAWNETKGNATYLFTNGTGLLLNNLQFNVTLNPFSTTDLTEGSNLYYTAARWVALFNAQTTDNVTEGSTNKYYATSLFDTDFALQTTDNLTEGSTNLYYTSARFDTDLGTKTTSDLTEGSNLYYTAARWVALFNAQTTDNITEGSTNLYDNQSFSQSLTDTLYTTPANCPAGEVVQNTTTSGVECIAPAGSGTVTNVATGDGLTGGPITSTGTISINATTCGASEFTQWNGTAFVCDTPPQGDITSVTTTGQYLTGGATSGAVALLLDETVLNATIDNRDADTTYTASGTLLDLSGTVFSINEGTLTDEYLCNYQATGTQLECTTNPASFSPVAGSASITTVGTISSGTWQGTAITDAYVANDITIQTTSDLDVLGADVNVSTGQIVLGDATFTSNTTCLVFTGPSGSILEVC